MTIPTACTDRIMDALCQYGAHPDVEIEVRLGKIVHHKGAVRFDPNLGKHALTKIKTSMGAYTGWTSRLDHVIQDSFFQDHVRVTRYESGVEIPVRKVRVCDVDVPLPEKPLDIRISISMETVVDWSEVVDRPSYLRHKTRTSFNDRHLFRYDLTEAKSPDSETAYECEIEMIKPNHYIQERGYAQTATSLCAKAMDIVDLFT